MATMNPQKKEEMRYSGGITGASTVNPDFANGSASPILSGQALATAQFGSGSNSTGSNSRRMMGTFDYSPKSSAPAKKAPAKAAAKPAPKPSVSASVAMAKTAPKVSSRPSGESYSAPKPKATVTSRADSGSLSKVAFKMPGIGPVASIASKANAPAASKPKASVNKMYKATYGSSVPKKYTGPERNFDGNTAEQVAAIMKQRMAEVARDKANPPKPKAKKPVSSSVNKMYKATYGTKLK